MRGVDPGEVITGDTLVVQDEARNVLTGEALASRDSLEVKGFGTWIAVASRSSSYGWRVHKGVKLVGHQARLL